MGLRKVCFRYGIFQQNKRTGMDSLSRGAGGSGGAGFLYVPLSNVRVALLKVVHASALRRVYERIWIIQGVWTQAAAVGVVLFRWE